MPCEVRCFDGNVPYRTVWGDNSPVGTPYKVKSRPHWVPCDVARSQRVLSEGTFSSPPCGGDASFPYKVGLNWPKAPGDVFSSMMCGPNGHKDYLSSGLWNSGELHLANMYLLRIGTDRSRVRVLIKHF